MEAMFQRARHAMEIALEKSREQARDLAVEATKRADEIKDLALDKVRASLGVASPNTSTTQIDEEEYQRYGITPELRDFVQGLTIDTFRDFPMEDQEIDGHISNNFDVLSPWKEHHALLVLSAVPEISEFRYKLCPKHIKDKRFWRIYFTLVDGHLAKYTTPAQDLPRVESQSDEHHTQGTVASAPLAAPKELETPGKSTVDDDEDLDNYLLGALDDDDDDDDEHLDEDDGSLDAEFEQLVKDTAMDSDTEKL